MIPPITWYILLPFAFDDKSAYLLQILLKICLIYLIITALMLIKCFLDSLYEISSEHEALKNRPLKRYLPDDKPDIYRSRYHSHHQRPD